MSQTTNYVMLCVALGKGFWTTAKTTPCAQCLPVVIDLGSCAMLTGVDLLAKMV